LPDSLKISKLQQKNDVIVNYLIKKRNVYTGMSAMMHVTN